MATNSVAQGFLVKDPACRLLECNSGMCAHNCEGAHRVDYKGRAVAGLGAGDGAHLPSGVPDFLQGVQAWSGKPSYPRI